MQVGQQFIEGQPVSSGPHGDLYRVGMEFVLVEDGVVTGVYPDNPAGRNAAAVAPYRGAAAANVTLDNQVVAHAA